MTKSYELISGRRVSTKSLRPVERRILERLLREAEAGPPEDVFGHSWTTKVMPRIAKLPAEERTSHPLYLIGQDLDFRLAIAQGRMAPPDYRDVLFDRIEEKFGSRYQFAKATGISQASLSQFLNGTREFSLGRLEKVAEALDLGITLLPLDELARRYAAPVKQRRKRVARTA